MRRKTPIFVTRALAYETHHVKVQVHFLVQTISDYSGQEGLVKVKVKDREQKQLL